MQLQSLSRNTIIAAIHPGISELYVLQPSVSNNNNDAAREDANSAISLSVWQHKGGGKAKIRRRNPMLKHVMIGLFVLVYSQF